MKKLTAATKQSSNPDADIVSTDTNIVQIFNDKYQSIRFFKDEGGKRYDGKKIGKDYFGPWTQKPNKMASEKLYEHFGETKESFRDKLAQQESRWSRICKRDEDYDITLGYRRDSFENAPFIVIGHDSNGEPRSYLTAGYKKKGGKTYLYIDTICSCLNSKDYCPLEDGVTHGPGGANLIAILLKKIMNVRSSNDVDSIILNSTPESVKAYENMGFRPYGNMRNFLQPMIIHISDMQGYIKAYDIEGVRTYGKEKKEMEKYDREIRELEEQLAELRKRKEKKIELRDKINANKTEEEIDNNYSIDSIMATSGSSSAGIDEVSSDQVDEDSMLAARTFTRGSSAQSDEGSIQDSMSAARTFTRGSSAQSDEDSMLAARRFTRGSSADSDDYWARRQALSDAENDEGSIQDSMSLEKRRISDSGQSDEDSMLAAKRRRRNSSEDSMMGGIKYKKSKKNRKNKQKNKTNKKKQKNKTNKKKQKTNTKKQKTNTKKRRNKK